MLATRQFTQDDQRKFAQASGDFNPMHMDALAARRTQAGAPVVHGMHTLLWLLDRIADGYPVIPSVATMKVRLARMIYIGEEVGARISQLDQTTLRAEALVEGTPAVALRAAFGQVRPSPAWNTFEDAPFVNPTEPCALSITEMERRSGRLPLPDAYILAKMFPTAAQYLGARRVAALAGSSYLVGMVMPGLHSIYAGLSTDMCEDDNSDKCAFGVTSVDARFRFVTVNFLGGGVSAQLETFVRVPPVRQASLESIAQLVRRNEFAGAAALIVGGSRGLGELTAKIIIAGGGKAIITYARGRADAENLATELKIWGGDCEAVAYDVRGDPETQLRELREMPSHIYYYATPSVTPTRSSAFNEKAYENFCAYYVTGFERLLNAVLRRAKGKICAFYPSSVFVDKPPAGMIEYAKAKADGEKMCAELVARAPALNIVKSRLPRMLTDLTATIQPVEMADSTAILLPLVRKSMSRMVPMG